MDHEFKKFLAVAEAGSFTQAAEHLRVSQPALSVAIKNLEQRLGAKLLIRDQQNFGLTQAGKIVYDSAARLRLELDAMRQILSQSSGRTAERFRIGTIDNVGQLLFKSGVDDTAEKLEVAVSDSRRLLEDLLLDRLDMAFITSPRPRPSSRLVLDEVGVEPMVLVASLSLKTNLNRQLALGRLGQFLSYNEESNTHHLIDRQLRRLGLEYAPQVSSSDPYLLKSLALAGRGASVLPFQLVAAELKRGQLVLAKTIIGRPVYSAYQSGKYLPPSVVKLIANIGDHLSRNYTAACRQAGVEAKSRQGVLPRP
ncbi:MAG TPA: LysR family transcriptional regulator [Candidatus Saccharimonadales bacterium]